MWRFLYLFLILVRLYFALSQSYIHPDEHFQGPDIITGEVFGYPTYKTWEFTSSQPVRSIFPIVLFYGWPLTVLKWIWEGLGYGDVPPTVTFYALRTWMFLLSFVMGDWAIHELVPSLHEGRVAIMLVASSYVTWTYQTHTFSNSIETLIVLWSLVLVNRLRDTSRTSTRSTVGLAFLGVLGVFNRITFPAYLIVPIMQLLPGLYRRPFRIPWMLLVALLTLLAAVTMDTEFHTGSRPRIRKIFSDAVITPWNNLTYNLDQSNLAQHGLHPFWQHLVANLPQLIGPAFPLVFLSSRKNTVYWSAMTGIIILSCFRHQEARFLLPAVPLLLASVRVPKKFARTLFIAWTFFNALVGILFGVYHQGGVVPAQNWIAQQERVAQAIWWKTYSPPRWLLGERNHQVATVDLMGMSGSRMLDYLRTNVSCEGASSHALLVAPLSATFLDPYTQVGVEGEIQLEGLWQYRRHIGLDDLDFGDDGIWPTLRRVIGRRGLGVWEVHRRC